MDILSTIGNSRLYNFHGHTQFCDGKADMEEFVREAVRQGFSHYGFTPHSPIPIASLCNMSLEDVQKYFDEFERLQSLYGDRIHLYKSMEIDYLGPEWGPKSEYFDRLGLDYKIGSVHFIPSQDGIFVDIDGRYDNFKGKMEQFFGRDIRYVVEMFYGQSLSMVEAGGFEIIGHLDKIGHNAGHYSPGIEDEPWYRRLVDDLIDAVASKGIIAELNTKAWADHNRMFPSVKLLKRVVDAGIPVIVNSDAHLPSLINSSRTKGFELLDAFQC